MKQLFQGSSEFIPSMLLCPQKLLQKPSAALLEGISNGTEVRSWDVTAEVPRKVGREGSTLSIEL